MKRAKAIAALAVACALGTGCLETGPNDLEGTSYTTTQPKRVLSGDAGAGVSEDGGTVTEALCPDGKIQCGQQCVDTSVSTTNCGGCGVKCAAGQVCTPDQSGASSCGVTCSGGTTLCGASCSRVESDPVNCGACGNACAVGQACVNSACVGATCTANSQELCYSGAPETLVGACKAGRKTCNATGTGFSACVGEKLPVTEICGDSIDNDCDGEVDEGCAVTLTVTKAGTGTGTVISSPSGISCPGTCSATYPSNTRVTLNANPSPNHTYAWSGGCTGSGACVVDMSATKSVGITFTAPPACNGRSQTFTYTPSKSFYNETFTPACTATTLVATGNQTCAPQLVDMKFNGSVGYTFLQSTTVNGVVNSYYSIAWPAGVQPVTTVNMTLSNVANANCSIKIALN